MIDVAHTRGQLVAFRADVVMHDVHPAESEAKLPVLISLARKVA